MTNVAAADTTVTLSIQVFENRDNPDWTKKGTVVVVELVDEAGEPVLPDRKDNGEITIRVPIAKTGIIHVYYRDEAGEYTEIKGARIEDGYAVFTTTHLSDYVIVVGTGVSATIADGVLNYQVAVPEGAINPQLLIAWYDDQTGQMQGCTMVDAKDGRLVDIRSDCTYKVILVSDAFAPLCPAAEPVNAG